MKNLSLEQALILRCCSTKPEKGKIKEVLSSDLNWNYVVETSCRHGVAGFVFRNTADYIEKKTCVSPWYNQLQDQYHKTAYKNLLFIREYNEITRTFTRGNIPLIALKGIALLNCIYKNVGLRSMSDIDILVGKKDVQEAEELLLQMGYIKHQEPGLRKNPHFHSIFQIRKNKIILNTELHWHVDFDSSSFNISIEDLWNRSIPASMYNPKSRKLCMEDSLLFNCFHVFRDGVKTILLKNLCDISETIEKAGPEINWQSIIERSDKYGIKRHVSLSLNLAKTLFNIQSHDGLLKNTGHEIVPFLIRNQVFSAAQNHADIPSGIINLLSERKLSNKAKIISWTFLNFLKKFQHEYRADLTPCITKTSRMFFARTYSIIERYIKAGLFFVLHPVKSKQLYSTKKKLACNISRINSWLRTDS